MKSPHQVRYTWTDCKGTHHGRTVVTASTQSEANAKLQRRHKHITVVY